jgi:hypothetical protein
VLLLVLLFHVCAAEASLQHGLQGFTAAKVAEVALQHRLHRMHCSIGRCTCDALDWLYIR